VTGPGKSTIILASEVSEQPQHILSATAGAHTALFDIPTSEVYAVRIVPLPRYKLNLDAGVLHAGGWIGNSTTEALMGGNLNLNMRRPPGVWRLLRLLGRGERDFVLPIECRRIRGSYGGV